MRAIHLSFVIVLGGILTGCVGGPDRSRTGPVDERHHVASASFEQDADADGTWLSPVIQPRRAFDELIYSWQIHQPGDTFRLYLKAIFSSSDATDWLYAGYWGTPSDLGGKRAAPRFDRGTLDMDWLKLTARARAFQFKVVSDGRAPLAAPPSLTVLTTDNRPTDGRPASHRLLSAVNVDGGGPARVLDVPLRRQFDSQGRRLIDRCQSAALAAAMEYFGRHVPMEDIVRFTFDSEYEYPGIWPRVIGAAQEFGFDAYLDRFRSWPEVRRALAQNKILLCSIRMKVGECESPPYPSMGNHIVALCGVTDDGRVVVTDSFLGKSGRGYLCQWRQSDFEHVWMQTKGGVAMVICPPRGAVAREVKALPPFPKDRPFPTGDDH